MQEETQSHSQFISITTYLKYDLSRRVQKNPKYSLRSYSRDLSVPLSTLSLVLSGDRKPTRKFIQKIAPKLGMSPIQVQTFSIATNDSQTIAGSNTIKDLILRDDQFNLLIDWRHFAILRLIHTKNFKPDVAWISRRLDTNPFHVAECIDRLKRLSLLKIEEKKWVDLSQGKTSYLKTSSTDENIKTFLKSMLEKSIASIDQDEITERNHTGMMVSISKNSLPLAIELIKSFRRSLTEILESKNLEKDEVYYLDISLFPLTKKEQPPRGNK